MKARTYEEMKAYVDGYNACFDCFCEVLMHSTGQPLGKCIQRMMVYVSAVNGILESEEKADEQN